MFRLPISHGHACAGGLHQRRRHAYAYAAATRRHDVQKELEEQGIFVMAQSRESLAEEASRAYKDVSDVIDAAQGAGISRKVARMRPLGVVKG